MKIKPHKGRFLDYEWDGNGEYIFIVDKADIEVFKFSLTFKEIDELKFFKDKVKKLFLTEIKNEKTNNDTN